MGIIEEMLLPSERVWTAVYVENKTEHYEIRTDNDSELGYHLLWHDTAPLGSTLSDFLYCDLSDLNDALTDAETAVSILVKNEISETSRMVQKVKLVTAARKLIHKNLFLLPFATAMFRLTVDPVKKSDLRTLRKLAERYKGWQTFFELLALEVFSADADIDRSVRYMEQRYGESYAFYPDLKYSEVSVEPIQRIQTKDGLRYYQNDLQHWFSVEPYFVAEVLNTEDADQFFYFMISKYLRAQLRMRSCKYCGRYFVLRKNYNYEYCDRPIEGSIHTCKEMGAMKLYDRRKNEDPAVRAYKRSYKTHYARIGYGRMTRDEFDVWSKLARALRDKCIAGELSLEEFDAWLESDPVR